MLHSNAPWQSYDFPRASCFFFFTQGARRANSPNIRVVKKVEGVELWSARVAPEYIPGHCRTAGGTSNGRNRAFRQVHGVLARAAGRESKLSQPRPFPVPPLPQFGSPVRGQSRALMRVLNCLDCTAGYPVHHEGAAYGVADCDSAAMLARSSLCQFTVSFRLRSLRRGDKCA